MRGDDDVSTPQEVDPNDSEEDYPDKPPPKARKGSSGASSLGKTNAADPAAAADAAAAATQPVGVPQQPEGGPSSGPADASAADPTSIADSSIVVSSPAPISIPIQAPMVFPASDGWYDNITSMKQSALKDIVITTHKLSVAIPFGR